MDVGDRDEEETIFLEYAPDLAQKKLDTRNVLQNVVQRDEIKALLGEITILKWLG